MRRPIHSRLFTAVVFCTIATSFMAILEAAAPVELELATDKGFPIAGAHKWSRALGRLELGSVRIRSMQSGDSPTITNRGTPSHPNYHVLGVLTARNRLRLPDGTYGLGDMAKLKRDLTSLQSDEEKQNAKIVAFGLTSDELQVVRQRLRPSVTFSTKGQPPSDVVRRIAKDGHFQLQIDSGASAKLAKAEAVYDEVEKISAGAALAAVLRPYGLVLEPRKQVNTKVELWVTTAKKDSSAWPIGWPSGKQETELLPVLMEFLNAEIDHFTLTETLDALQPRVKTPFLLDHNSLAKHSIDPEKITITIPPKRTYYKSLLRKVLFQARLKSEARVDEADQPLIWITTIKK